MSHEACPHCHAPDGSVAHRVEALGDGVVAWTGIAPGLDRAANLRHVAIWATCTVCTTRWQTWPRPTSENEPTT